ncbi:hypothetical protein DAI22_02g227500 [Oryza sativa Japonica Group]|nr:hypothetical protein DAI22_02g227500 [Oryza sativa Japonica Group]
MRSTYSTASKNNFSLPIQLPGKKLLRAIKKNPLHPYPYPFTPHHPLIHSSHLLSSAAEGHEPCRGLWIRPPEGRGRRFWRQEASWTMTASGWRGSWRLTGG